jgi:hypothetical protein
MSKLIPTIPIGAEKLTASSNPNSGELHAISLNRMIRQDLCYSREVLHVVKTNKYTLSVHLDLVIHVHSTDQPRKPEVILLSDRNPLRARSLVLKRDLNLRCSGEAPHSLRQKRCWFSLHLTGHCIRIPMMTREMVRFHSSLLVVFFDASSRHLLDAPRLYS